MPGDYARGLCPGIVSEEGSVNYSHRNFRSSIPGPTMSGGYLLKSCRLANLTVTHLLNIEQNYMLWTMGAMFIVYITRLQCHFLIWMVMHTVLSIKSCKFQRFDVS